MKWFNNIFLISLLLFITGSTNSSSPEDARQIYVGDTLVLPTNLETIQSSNIDKEIKEVKVLMSSTQRDLKELKVLIEQKKYRDSLMIEYYVTY